MALDVGTVEGRGDYPSATRCVCLPVRGPQRDRAQWARRRRKPQPAPAKHPKLALELNREVAAGQTARDNSTRRRALGRGRVQSDTRPCATATVLRGSVE